MSTHADNAAWGRSGRLLLLCLVVLLGFTSALAAQENGSDTLYFIQVSDTHWGFNNPRINPDYAGTLNKGIAEINGLQGTPDFLIFSGDETHITSDDAVRRTGTPMLSSFPTARCWTSTPRGDGAPRTAPGPWRS